jgi:tetratricopeptide (TPR) repeat protein
MSRTKRTHQKIAGKSAVRVAAKPAPVPSAVKAGRPKVGLSDSLSLPMAAAFLAAICLLAYWNSFRAGFLLDNQSIILQDTRLRAIDWNSIRNIFTFNYWWPTFESDLFRPLTTLTYWFNYSVLGNGENPGGYHAVNLLLHFANVLLACMLIRGITRRPWVALFAAAIIASHPLTVESVTNIVGRADLLAGMSILGGLVLYRGYLAASAASAEQARPLRRLGRPAVWLAGLGAVYLAGVFCKESAVVLPALMLLHGIAVPPVEDPPVPATDERPGRAVPQLRGPQRGSCVGVPNRRQAAAGGAGRLAAELHGTDACRSVVRAWPAYLSLLPGAAALLLARWAMFHNSPIFAQNGADNPIAIAGFWTGLMTAVKVAGYYLALFIWPATLSCDYSYNQITLFGWTLASGQDLHAWIALAVLVGLLAAAIIAWRRERGVVFFLGFAAITFLPTANVLFPIGTIMAERLMYAPLAGLAALSALLLSAAGHRLLGARPESARRQWAIAGGVVAAVVVVALAARTIARNEDWTSNLRLWTSATRATPNNYRAYRALASAIMESDPSGARVDEALETALRGVRIMEQAPLPLQHMPAGLYTDVGWYYTRKAERLIGEGQVEQGQTAIAQALKRLKQAEAIDREMNRQGRERLLKAGLRREEIHDVGNPVVYRNLGSAYLLAGDPMQAIDVYTYLQHIQPADYDAHFERGVAEATAAQFEQKRGNQKQAEEHLDLAAVNLIVATILNPDHDRPWQVLARIYQYISASSPAVVAAADGRRTLNMQNPAVPGHLQRACRQLVQLLIEGGRREDAGAWRQRMIDEFHIPPATFPPSPPAR